MASRLMFAAVFFSLLITYVFNDLQSVDDLPGEPDTTGDEGQRYQHEDDAYGYFADEEIYI